MKRTFAVLACLLLLLGPSPYLRAQSTLTTTVLAQPIGQTCYSPDVNTSCYFTFYLGHSGGVYHYVRVNVDYTLNRLSVLFQNVGTNGLYIGPGSGDTPTETVTVTATLDPNLANKTHYHVEFDQADEIVTNQYGSLIGPTTESVASGSADFAITTAVVRCQSGKGGSKNCTTATPDSTTTATINY